MRRRFRNVALFALAMAAIVIPATVSAHIERASYWPDPGVDKNVRGGAGGKVPKARSLASALRTRPVGRTRVVCQPNSMKRLRIAVRRGRRHGFDIRPHDHRSLTRKRARGLMAINRKLRRMCRYHQIQPAVNASRNNDRVVVMPGVYTEPTARSKPTFDPSCDRYEITNDKSQTGAVSYAYQYHCPNDQNLIAVLGRRPGTGQDPSPPLTDRHNIPNSGECVRCNLQLEGSGVSADDVIVDAGRVRSRNSGPIAAKKDVGIRADRADGFVLRGMTVRHAEEHDIYVLESDGFLLDRFKTFYGGEYGVLTFVEDHGLIQNCEAVGNGDSGLYPGAGAETGAQRISGAFRYSQEIRNCDSHHNSSGYSGTDGNSVWLHDNNFYDNALGFTTDVFTAPGHPGFPQDSDLIEHNNFYSNNFNVYAADSDVKPTVPVPVGTGMWIAGGNENVVRDNRFYDNWRRGTMLFAVPDATVCGDSDVQVPGCDVTKLSTSYNNRFYGNQMGVAPGGDYEPNGTDFWWDSFVGNTGNCWYQNTGASGHAVTTSPATLPACANGDNPQSSIGTGDAANETELVGCLAALNGGGYDPTTCSWFAAPPKP